MQVWEAWLGLDTHWHDDEIIINEVRGKNEADWTTMMKQAMAECYRVLKPGRWLSLCYHDTSAGTWSLVQDIMAEVGFIADVDDFIRELQSNKAPEYKRSCGNKLWRFYDEYLQMRPHLETETEDVLKHMVESMMSRRWSCFPIDLPKYTICLSGRCAQHNRP
jgi:hypothetical protein